MILLADLDRLPNDLQTNDLDSLLFSTNSEGLIP